MKQIILHIGTHKTGSTSLQRYLFDREAYLLRQGIALYHGQHIDDNHIELYLASMRYTRDSFAKQSLTNLVVDESYTEAVAARVRAFMESSEAPRVLLTTEGLSLLRFRDELERLRYILGDAEAEVSVVLYLREKSAYLDSYRKQLFKKEGRLPSKEYWSALYIEPDTWLTDYETLVQVYRDAFGDHRVTVMDYDKEMSTVGNIIPSFLKAIAVPPEAEGDSATYFENRTENG